MSHLRMAFNHARGLKLTSDVIFLTTSLVEMENNLRRAQELNLFRHASPDIPWMPSKRSVADDAKYG